MKSIEIVSMICCKVFNQKIYTIMIKSLTCGSITRKKIRLTPLDIRTLTCQKRKQNEEFLYKFQTQ